MGIGSLSKILAVKVDYIQDRGYFGATKNVDFVLSLLFCNADDFTLVLMMDASVSK